MTDNKYNPIMSKRNDVIIEKYEFYVNGFSQKKHADTILSVFGDI